MKINCLEDLADVLLDNLVKYCGFRPSEINKGEIIGDLVNDSDVICYLEGVPVNADTIDVFKYVFENHIAHGEDEQKYMKMVLDENVSFSDMKASLIEDYSDPDEITAINLCVAKNKFALYDEFFDNFDGENFYPERWYGLYEYFENKQDISEKPTPSRGELLKLYEAYKLNWMAEHGWTLEHLLVELDKIALWAYESHDFEERPKDTLVSQFFDEFYENGFNGELWACFDEWYENDFQLENE